MIIYLAHPLGQEPRRTANQARARRWFAWLLVERPEDSIVAPWLLYSEALDESAVNRTRGIRDGMRCLVRGCDSIVLCGGQLSPGMSAELDEAVRLGLIVINLLNMGDEPPVIL